MSLDNIALLLSDQSMGFAQGWYGSWPYSERPWLIAAPPDWQPDHGLWQSLAREASYSL